MPDDNMPVIRDRAATAIAVYRPPEFLMPTSIGAVKELAKMYCEADWVPKAYRDRNGAPMAAKVEVGIMHGLEVGLRPLAALQSIAVINGMPCVWGDGMLGLVRDSGLLEDIEETYEGTGDEMAAICVAKRRGQQTPITGRFTVAMAKKAGLWEKQGPWQGYPARMLRMRARSWALRDGFADVLRGIRSAEEVLDMGDLVEGEGGVYSPRPQREDYVAEQVQTASDAGEKQEVGADTGKKAAREQYEVVDAEGEVHKHASAAKAVSAFEKEMEKIVEHGGQKLEDLWEANAMLLTQLRETNKGKTADALAETYSKHIGECDKRARAKPVESTREAERAIPQERTIEDERARAAESTNTRERASPAESTTSKERAKSAESTIALERKPAVAWSWKHPGYVDNPQSPLSGGGRMRWLSWANDMLTEMPLEQVEAFIAANSKEFEFYRERLVDDFKKLSAVARNRGFTL